MTVQCDLVESYEESAGRVYGLVFFRRSGTAVFLARGLGNRAEVENLRDLFNRNDLDELHIRDVLADMTA